VWCFRWREAGADGRKYTAASFLELADDLKSLALARKAVVGLRREINRNDIRIRRKSITLADLSRHFQQQRELVRAIPASPIQRGKLTKVISGNGSSLGGASIGCFEIRAVEVESWLKSLNRAPGTRCKIRK